MTIESALGFIVALLVWISVPGPAILAIIARSLSAGLQPALRLVAGVLLGDVFYMSIVLLGMAAIGKVLGEFFVIFRILGACYLMFLGVRLWIRKPAFDEALPDSGKADGYKSFLTGFGITLGNPKAILFHLGFLPTFFDLSRIGVADAFMIMAIFLTVIGTCLSTYAYTANWARRFFRNAKKMLFINRLSGSVLIGAGIAVIARR